MSKKYCYKVKHNIIKVEKDNAYAHPLIEKYGFKPVQEGENGEYYWTGVWAKTVNIDKKSSVAKWVKRSIENIYKKEKELAESKWIKEITEAGYEFDEDGKLAENPHYLEGLTGQLCVDSEGEYSGTIYLNMSGCVEFYDSDALLGAAFKEIMQLIKAEVIYKVRLITKTRKKKRTNKVNRIDAVVNNKNDNSTPVGVRIAKDAREKAKQDKKAKKNTNGNFIVKTSNGYFVEDNKFSNIKEKATVFHNFKDAKKVNKQLGGKIIAL